MNFLFVIVAIVAVASAAEEKKPADDKPRLDEKPRLQWPLPDPVSEGDLMLHGSISYDRVRALHKGKLEDDVDKMILAHGRLFLRRVSKFFDDNAEFKIMPILCRDSRNLNATNNRWRIEIPKVQQADQNEGAQKDSPVPKSEKSDKAEKAEDQPRNVTVQSNQTEITTVLPSSEKPSEKPTDKPSTTLKPEIEKPNQEKDTYEVRRRDFYRQVGSNFARLLMREYRKEALITEESEYLARWIADEAVHYGAVAIYCNEGENVKEIKKQLVTYLEEKA